MSSQSSIPWPVLEKLITFYEEKIKKLIIAKEVIELENCEKEIPKIFKGLYDIIHPALNQCGVIKEGVDDKFLAVLIKNVVKMQANMQVSMKRDDCLTQCIATIRSDLSSLGIQMEELMPSFTRALEANFESLSS